MLRRKICCKFCPELSSPPTFLLGDKIVQTIGANFVRSLASPSRFLLGRKIVYKFDANCVPGQHRSSGQYHSSRNTKIERSEDKGTVGMDLPIALVGSLDRWFLGFAVGAGCVTIVWIIALHHADAPIREFSQAVNLAITRTDSLNVDLQGATVTWRRAPPSPLQVPPGEGRWKRIAVVLTFAILFLPFGMSMIGGSGLLVSGHSLAVTGELSGAYVPVPALLGFLLDPRSDVLADKRWGQ